MKYLNQFMALRKEVRRGVTVLCESASRPSGDEAAPRRVARKYLDPSRFRAGGGNGPSQAAAISMICNVARRRVRTNKCDFNAHLSINYLTHS